MTPAQLEDMANAYRASRLKVPSHPHPYGIYAPYVNVPGNRLMRVVDSVKEIVGAR